MLATVARRSGARPGTAALVFVAAVMALGFLSMSVQQRLEVTPVTVFEG